jgi:hypothetical protein
VNTYQFDYPSMRFFLIYGIEALAYLGVAAYSVTALRREWWAVCGALGGLAAGLAALVLSVGWGQVEFGDGGDSSVFRFTADHDAVGQAMDYAAVVGLVLVAAAFLRLARNRSK